MNTQDTNWIVCDVVTKSYKLWSRFKDGEQIYQASENQPGPNDGGYPNPDSAIKVKGLSRTQDTRHQHKHGNHAGGCQECPATN